ncbi:MAG: hypothetical protein V8Q84_01210 [Bilophila sp.]
MRLRAHQARAAPQRRFGDFISYVDDPSQKTRGFEVGGVDYITKPFHDAEVLARVRTHIMIKQMREQLNDNAQIGKELDEHRRQLAQTGRVGLPGNRGRGHPHARRAVNFVSDGVLGLTGYARTVHGRGAARPAGHRP